jgi:hypothetical protein
MIAAQVHENLLHVQCCSAVEIFSNHIANILVFLIRLEIAIVPHLQLEKTSIRGGNT